MIGIIGYGMVGKAVKAGFPADRIFTSDPKYNTVTVVDICNIDPDAIFVCLPTPTDGSEYSLLRNTLDEIAATDYAGLVVVKSTVPPQYLTGYDVVYNPEFLSRATAEADFINPPMLIVGGRRANELVELYKSKSIVKTEKVFVTDIKTAAMAKYAMNSFYATKVTFMNEMYDVAEQLGVQWNDVTTILKVHPWMGTHHFDVPGPDGERGFGGPCLPKDTEALVKEFDVKLLKFVLERNKDFRK
jgi:UDPglucose 6-dehydrogenase